METSVIIVLAIILLILIALNNIHIITNPTQPQATCSQTTFGCCPDGINSKNNFYGTNCPGYRPIYGYPPQPVPPPPPPQPQPAPSPNPPKPIGGCAGTRYGCCPDNVTPKIDMNGSNCLQPAPIPNPPLIGGCAGTRYGCCPDNVTPKIDMNGSNCLLR